MRIRNSPFVLGFPVSLFIVVTQIAPLALTYAATVQAATVNDSLNTLANEFSDPTTQYLVGLKYYRGEEYPLDKTQAAKWFTLAADSGNYKAQYYLGLMYMKGDGVKVNKHKALEYLRQAADKRHEDAPFQLGNLYLLGLGKAPDYPNALLWFKAAAQQNHPEAAFKLGKLSAEGKAGAADLNQARKWLKVASELGSADAEAYLKVLARNDNPTKPSVTAKPKTSQIVDIIATPNATLKQPPTEFVTPPIPGRPVIEAALRSMDSSLLAKLDKGLLERAQAGNVDALYDLGMQLAESDESAPMALTWLRQAANQDHAGAQYQLGLMYRDGIGVKTSESEAIKLFRLAASWGVSAAQHDLDQLLRRQLIAGESLFQSNPELANPNSQYSLGLMYTNGDGVSKDMDTAIQWLQKAAAQDHSEAQYFLGELYRNGNGIDSDHNKAKFWLAKAADKGVGKARSALQTILQNEEQRLAMEQVTMLRSSPVFSLLADARNGRPEAQFRVGMAYVDGTSLQRDMEKGLIWLERAAEDQHIPAQLALAEIYFNGQNINKDYLQALHWYNKAADAGSAEAQYHIGNIYKRGLGVKASNADAIKWYRLAAAKGHEKAKTSLGGCRIC